MDRAEATGVGVAVAGHLVLFAALSLSLLKPPELPKIENDPIDIAIVDEVAVESSAPAPVAAPAPPAPKAEPFPPAPAPAPSPRPEPVAPPPPAPKLVAKPTPAPKPVAKPTPPSKPVAKVAPKPAPKPQPKPATKPKAAPPKVAQRPADERPRRRPGLSRDILEGLGDTPAPSRPTTATKPATSTAKPAATGTPAKVASPQVASAIASEIRRQLKPHWKSPTGADVELLRTTLSVRLNADGTLDGAPTLKSQSGANESNRSQARLHVDQAIKAVRLAAPFKLPAEYYDAWKLIEPNFDKRLSQ